MASGAHSTVIPFPRPAPGFLPQGQRLPRDRADWPANVIVPKRRSAPAAPVAETRTAVACLLEVVAWTLPAGAKRRVFDILNARSLAGDVVATDALILMMGKR